MIKSINSFYVNSSLDFSTFKGRKIGRPLSEKKKAILKRVLDKFSINPDSFNVQKLFKNFTFPLILEIGCGSGEFLIDQAKKNPKKGFIAIEPYINGLASISSKIEKEFYLAILVDRQTSQISFVASTEGGMDIEEVAASSPEKILSFSVDPSTGYQGFHGRRIAFNLGLEGKQIKQCVVLMGKIYQLFVDKDMEMLEINPLIVSENGNLKCLDAKMGFDGNAI